MGKGLVYCISLKHNSLTVKVSSCGAFLCVLVEDDLQQRHDLQSHYVFMMILGIVIIR